MPILSPDYKEILFGWKKDTENAEMLELSSMDSSIGEDSSDWIAEVCCEGFIAMITQIIFSDQIPSKNVLENAGTNIFQDVSEAKDGSILGWVEKAEQRNGEVEYILHLDANDTIYAPEDSSYLFAGFSNLQTIEWGDCFETCGVTDMHGMFRGCEQLSSLNLKEFDTFDVTNMADMFFDCKKLTNLDLSSFVTGNVTNLSEMFVNCERLRNLNLSSFDTQNVTDMSAMFEDCAKLESLDVSHFDTQNVTNMNWMFRGCSQLKSLDVSGFDTQNVTDMRCMFGYCTKLESLDVSGFDTQNVTDMNFMFEGCDSLPTLAKRVGKKGRFHSLKSFLKG